MSLRQAVKRGIRLLAAHALGRAIPFQITLYVTNRCNLRCVYCSCPDHPTTELTAAEWCEVLAELRELGTERVAFFGGEPLLRDDLAPIVSTAHRLGIRTALTSNGTLVPLRPEVIRRLDTLVLSLDGPPEAHDGNRGAGNHREVMRAVEAARGWGVAVKANAVLNANNAETLDWLCDWSRRERVPLSLNIMRFEPNGLWRNASDHCLDNGQLRGLIERIIDAKRTNPYILFSTKTYRNVLQWRDYSRDRLTVAEAGRRFAGPCCSAGRLHCAIYPDGRLFPCALTTEQVPALDVRTAGVTAALARSGQHGCATCFSPCMQEINGVFALDPRPVANLVLKHSRFGIE
jgi:MoaA/NifB/PqqE/SkfB family radical SAM enzyme